MEFKKIKNLIKEKETLDKDQFRNALKDILQTNVTKNQIDNYIGDYPSMIEPVILGKDVKIGDDVLLGPNVYIGDDVEIGDYDEISNSIILKDAKLGEIFKFDYCIVEEGSQFTFTNLNLKNCILSGNASSKKDVNKKCFES